MCEEGRGMKRERVHEGGREGEKGRVRERGSANISTFCYSVIILM